MIQKAMLQNIHVPHQPINTLSLFNNSVFNTELIKYISDFFHSLYIPRGWASHKAALLRLCLRVSVSCLPGERVHAKLLKLSCKMYCCSTLRGGSSLLTKYNKIRYGPGIQCISVKKFHRYCLSLSMKY